MINYWSENGHFWWKMNKNWFWVEIKLFLRLISKRLLLNQKGTIRQNTFGIWVTKFTGKLLYCTTITSSPVKMMTSSIGRTTSPVPDTIRYKYVRVVNVVEITEVRNYGLRNDHNFSSKLFQQFHNPYLFLYWKMIGWLKRAWFRPWSCP